MARHQGRPATYRKRLLAWLVDTACLCVYAGMVAALAIWLKTAWVAVISGALYVLIKVYFWTMSTTLGKRLMGLKIVKRQSQKDLSMLEMANRQVLGKFLSVMFLYVGVIWILIDRDHQGWHDKMVDSIVVERGSHALETGSHDKNA